MIAALSGTRIERNTSTNRTKAPSTTATITIGRYVCTRSVRSMTVAVLPPTWASSRVPAMAWRGSFRRFSTSVFVAWSSGAVCGVIW